MFNGLELRENLRYTTILYHLPATTRRRIAPGGSIIATETGLEVGYFTGRRRETALKSSAPDDHCLLQQLRTGCHLY